VTVNYCVQMSRCWPAKFIGRGKQIVKMLFDMNDKCNM